MKELMPPIEVKRQQSPPVDQWEVVPIPDRPRKVAPVPLRYSGKPAKRPTQVHPLAALIVIGVAVYGVFRHQGQAIDCTVAEGSLHCIVVERPAPWHQN